MSYDFNPRSREGSDGDKQVVATEDFISIRAPARGATELKRYHVL